MVTRLPKVRARILDRAGGLHNGGVISTVTTLAPGTATARSVTVYRCSLQTGGASPLCFRLPPSRLRLRLAGWHHCYGGECQIISC